MKKVVHKSIILLYLISIIFSLSSQANAWFFRKKNKKKQEVEKITPKSSSTPTSSPQIQENIDIFKKEYISNFKYNPSKIKKILIRSCGYKNYFEAYEISPGKILIPLSLRETDILVDRFGSCLKYEKENEEIIITRGKNIFKMKANYSVADLNGTKKEIEVPPRMIDGMLYISPNSFSKFLWASFIYDEERDEYFLDPFLLDVKIETKRGLQKVVARGTGPFKNRILKLRKPNRFVIDVMNSVLDGKARSIEHSSLGPIRFSQHTVKGKEGNIVRIVIPESESYEVALSQSRSSNFVEAELRKRNSITLVEDMAIQKIKSLKIVESGNKVKILLETTGPVQIEGTRLLPPDDRIFIDIPRVLYPDKKKEFTLENDFLPSIRVAQNVPMPNPKVRIVLPLEGPKKVTMRADKNNHNLVKITITNDKINPRLDRNLFLVSYFATKGIIVCLDPGHGGSDPGACNRRVGLKEKHLTLDISRRLLKLLRKNGWNVVMTRNSDRDVTYAGSPNWEELNARSSVANGVGAHIFISIHINASVKSHVRGFGTYYYKRKDLPLARYIQKSMVKNLNCKSIGVRKERFFVLSHTRMPAILIEAGFISNSKNAKFLANPKFRQKIAESIMEGLIMYAQTRKIK